MQNVYCATLYFCLLILIQCVIFYLKYAVALYIFLSIIANKNVWILIQITQLYPIFLSIITNKNAWFVTEYFELLHSIYSPIIANTNL